MGPTIERLNDLAACWSGPMARAAWQGGLAIAAAWILVRCRPGIPARVACWLWRLADLKLLVTLLWATPLLLPLLPPPRAPRSLPATPALASAPDFPPSSTGGSGALSDPAGAPGAPLATHRSGPASVAFLLWLSGLMGIGVLVGRGWLDAARLRRSCPPVERPDLHEAAAELARVLGLRRIPEVRAGPSVAQPMLVGAFRPAILLPAELVEGPRLAPAIRPILAHELAHVRRRDLVWSGLTGLVRALFFFHPLVWLAHREALLAREAACDALALRASGVRPAEYARILLEIAAGGRGRPAGLAATLGMAGSAGTFKRRLNAMQTTQQPSRRRLLSWASALLALGAIGMIPWRLVPRAVLAQDPPAVRPANVPVRDDAKEDEQPSDAAGFVEAMNRATAGRLEVARSKRRVAEALVEQAEAEADQAVAMREYRAKELVHYGRMVRRGRGPQELVDEMAPLVRKALAAEREAKAQVIVSRASLEAARAAVREAEVNDDLGARPDRGRAERDAARVGARLDRARAERDGARAEIDRVEANQQEARATVEHRTMVFERLKALGQARKIAQSQVDEAGQSLAEARDAERDAGAAIDHAGARLKAAEARLKLAAAVAARR